MKSIIFSLILGVAHAAPAALICSSQNGIYSAALKIFGYPQKYEVSFEAPRAYFQHAVYEAVDENPYIGGKAISLELASGYPSTPGMPQKLKLNKRDDGSMRIPNLFQKSFGFNNCYSTGPCGKDHKYCASIGECIPEWESCSARGDHCNGALCP